MGFGEKLLREGRCRVVSHHVARAGQGDDDVVSVHFNVKVALILHTPKTREVAIGQLIMHVREHLVGIKPLGRRSIPIAETLGIVELLSGRARTVKRT